MILPLVAVAYVYTLPESPRCVDVSANFVEDHRNTALTTNDGSDGFCQRLVKGRLRTSKALLVRSANYDTRVCRLLETCS